MVKRHKAFRDLEAEYKHIQVCIPYKASNIREVLLDVHLLLRVQDPNLRRRLILRDINDRPFGRAHVRAILVAGTGFLTDSYDVRIPHIRAVVFVLTIICRSLQSAWCLICWGFVIFPTMEITYPKLTTP